MTSDNDEREELMATWGVQLLQIFNGESNGHDSGALYSFFEAVASCAAAADALASRQIDQVKRAFHSLTSDAVAAGDEQLEHAMGARGALVASSGGGGAGAQRAVKQAGDLRNKSHTHHTRHTRHTRHTHHTRTAHTECYDRPSQRATKGASPCPRCPQRP